MNLKQIELSAALRAQIASVPTHPTSGANGHHKLKLGWASSARSDFCVIDLEWGQFPTLFGVSDERESKDGPCISAGAARQDADVQAVCALIYDIDGAASIFELDAHLDVLGLEALLWTTHNHGTTLSDVTADEYRRWADRSGLSCRVPSEVDFTCFLASQPCTRHHRDVKLCGEGAPRSVMRRGKLLEIIEFEHAAVDKSRVMFPLSTPVPVSNGLGIDGYHALYMRVGHAIFGSRFDISCKNPSRIHYLPSHRADAPFSVLYYHGALLDAESFWSSEIEASVQEERTNRERLVRTRGRAPARGLDSICLTLKSIPPDVPYADWLRVIAAVYHETQGCERGLALLHTWSSGDCRYDPDELDEILEWLAAREGQCTRPATMGTLIHLATQHDPRFRAPLDLSLYREKFKQVLDRQNPNGEH